MLPPSFFKIFKRVYMDDWTCWYCWCINFTISVIHFHNMQTNANKKLFFFWANKSAKRFLSSSIALRTSKRFSSLLTFSNSERREVALSKSAAVLGSDALADLSLFSSTFDSTLLFGHGLFRSDSTSPSSKHFMHMAWASTIWWLKPPSLQ